jgi:predicted GNAT family acetyltransferase
MADLVEDGHSGRGIAVTNADHVVVARRSDNGELVGVLVYVINRPKDLLWVNHAAVKEQYRGQGIHRKMHAMLKDIARKENVYEVGSYVSIENRASVGAHSKRPGVKFPMMRVSVPVTEDK